HLRALHSFPTRRSSDLEDVLRAGRAAARERRAWDGVLDHLPDLGLRVEPNHIEVARGGLARYDDGLSAVLLRAAARRAGLVLGRSEEHTSELQSRGHLV